MFWDLVEMTEGCWWWTGPCNEHGYGVYMNTGAHRAVLEQTGDPRRLIGKDVHHICCNPRCVRPDHLELLNREDHRLRHTRRKSTRRMTGKGSITRIGDNHWRLRVFVGTKPSGTPIQRSMNFRGTEKEARAELSRFREETYAAQN